MELLTATALLLTHTAMPKVKHKKEMERLIADIKSDFRSEISMNDPKVKKLRKLSGDLFRLDQSRTTF
jgi:adenine-specific DNA-methyltransferase